MHIHSHLIPTIERESLDLQDPHIAVWNKELLSIIGQITRFIYDRTLSENIHLITGSASSTALLAPFSFQTTSPDSQIGDALLRGFLASKSIIQVPTRLSPLHPQLSLMPASDARLATSASLHEFLDLPLVPFELAQTAFFIALKRMELMTDVNQEIIVDTLSKSILMATALVTLLQWLQKEHPNDRDFVQRIFSVVRFSERVDSSVVIHLCRIKYFDTLNIPKVLPLPLKVLPLSIACHFAVEDLRLRFSLTKCPLNSYIEFFLSDGQSFLFREAQTSEEVLRFISKYSSQLTDSVWTKIKAKLSQIRCISTSRGMKLPSESYLPSSLSTENQPMVNFQLSQTSIDVIDDDSIPVAFLKRIGCRIFDVTLRLSNSSGGENMRLLIQSLIEERANLADADFQSLQETQFLTGSTSTHGVFCIDQSSRCNVEIVDEEKVCCTRTSFPIGRRSTAMVVVTHPRLGRHRTSFCSIRFSQRDRRSRSAGSRHPSRSSRRTTDQSTEWLSNTGRVDLLCRTLPKGLFQSDESEEMSTSLSSIGLAQ